MASEKDLLEIRTRDFLKNVDHYHDADNVQTDLIFGTRPETPVFLTIIVPVYDHPIEFIRRSISSALNQPCSYDFQLLVIDYFLQIHTGSKIIHSFTAPGSFMEKLYHTCSRIASVLQHFSASRCQGFLFCADFYGKMQGCSHGIHVDLI